MHGDKIIRPKLQLVVANGQGVRARCLRWKQVQIALDAKFRIVEHLRDGDIKRLVHPYNDASGSLDINNGHVGDLRHIAVVGEWCCLRCCWHGILLQ